MIPQTDLSWQEESWQSALQNALTNLDELLELLNLTRAQVQASTSATEAFALRVPRAFAARMERGNPKDPLLLQVLAAAPEMSEVAGYTQDPLQETESNPLPGLIHKYKNRVLLTLSGACAVHCRYCFRRHFDYSANNPGTQGWGEVVQYLKDHPEVDEVIYSGGDPLSASDAQLDRLTSAIKSVASVRRLRVHTRFPVVIPQRITANCIAWLTQFENPVVVLHINHANEIDAEVVRAAAKLRAAGVTLLNQAVLLRGINDSLAAQTELQKRTFEAGVLPYYLHLMDAVAGAAHFDVPEREATALHAGMREALPGYLLPKLVREIPGERAKTRVA